MADTAKLISDLIRDEGLKLAPYHCTAGKLTIGVGRNLDDVGISKDEAMTLLATDLARCRKDCEKQSWWLAVAEDEVRSRAMLNMCFNLGIRRLSGFKNTLDAIHDKRWKDAAAGMRASLWAKQVGPRAERLARMIETGTDI